MLPALLAAAVLGLPVQDGEVPPNISLLSLKYNAEGKMVLRYSITPGTKGFLLPVSLDLAFTAAGGSWDNSQKILENYPLENEAGIHEETFVHGTLPARFTRVTAFADRKRTAGQANYSDDKKDLTAVLAPGFRRLYAGQGIATYAKGTGLSTVYATVVELRRATARILGNGKTGNVAYTPSQWWTKMASVHPAGRSLKAMINGTFFGTYFTTFPLREMWYSPDLDLYYAHGLKTTASGVSMLPSAPKPYTWCIGWNAGYAMINTYNPSDFGGYAKPWFSGSEFSAVVGGIGPTNVTSPTLAIARNWLGVTVVEKPVIMGNRWGYDALISLFSFKQTAGGMWTLPDMNPFVQLDAGGSTTLFGAGMGQQSVVKVPRYLPHVIGFYSN